MHYRSIDGVSIHATKFEKEDGTSKSHSQKSQGFFKKIKEVWEDIT